MKTLALVFEDITRVALREIALPPLEPDDIQVRVAYSGISSGTERWILTGKYKGVTYPLIPGYQAAGVIERAGANVSNWKEGDRVLVLGTRVVQGEPRPMWGGHAATVVCNQAQALAVPDGTPLSHAAQAMLPAVAYHGLEVCGGCGKDDLVVVTGLGLVGLAAVQLAREAGARVVATDVVPERVALARTLGATEALLFDEAALAKSVKELKAEGADLVIDTSAAEKAINFGFELLKAKGRFCFQGYYPGLTSIDFFTPHVKELVFYNPTSCSLEDKRAVLERMARQTLDMEAVVGPVFQAAQGPEAFRQVWEEPSAFMAGVIAWHKE